MTPSSETIREVRPASIDSELSARQLLPPGYLAGFVAGSLVRGWGNATSDLDVYLVSTDQLTRPTPAREAVGVQPGYVPMDSLYVDGCRWDIKYWTRDQVDQVLAKVSWAQFDANPGESLLAPKELDLLERIQHGLPLRGADWLREQAERIGASALRSILVSQLFTMSDSFVEDVVGQLAAGDQESAVLSARLAFGYAIDGLVASAGEIGRSAKWRARRMRLIQQDVVDFDEYWRMETMADLDADQPRQWIEDVLALCRRICTEVSL